jgi:hypothetical protein
MNKHAANLRRWVKRDLARDRRTRFGLARAGRTIDSKIGLCEIAEQRSPEDEEDWARSRRDVLLGFIRDFTKSEHHHELIRVRILTGASFPTLARRFGVTEVSARTLMSRFYKYLGVHVRIERKRR